MTTPGKGQPRKVVARYGVRGDQVIVKEDKRAGMYVVHYRDADGVPHKRSWPLTRDGRAAAIAWGATYHEARAALAARQETRRPITLRDLWVAYTESPAFQHLRPSSRIAYLDRWTKWERFLTREARVDDTTLLDVDRFITAARTLGMAINQVRQVLNVARVVYRWGETRELVTRNRLALYRWQKPKDAKVNEPDEYTADDFRRLVAELPPQSGRTWRAHVALMLAGSLGQRANAVRHLRWDAIAGGVVTWPEAFQKMGEAHEQPLTWDAVAALETARWWRARTGYGGPWVIFAGGGNKKLGAALAYGAGGTRRRQRTEAEDRPVTYQALYRQLVQAERRAGVAHRPYRALHGFRRMIAGDVADATGDARLGMEWIGDRDMKQARSYLRRRQNRLERAATAADSASGSVHKVSPNRPDTTTAPKGAEVTTDAD